jgi:phosphoribosylanthranilate isomerase
MFQIKICGITSVDDALAVARAGADAIGLNFYRRSPRFIDLQTADAIVQKLPSGVAKVGLFVDTPADEICEIYEKLSLDLIQLHGDQPPEFSSQLGGRPTMRAFRISSKECDIITNYLYTCRRIHCSNKYVLIDSYSISHFGGSGQIADWDVAKQYLKLPDVPPLVLAGGLTSANVAEAIRAVRPAAVDVASGVESQPGRKDPVATAKFVEAARAAFTS